MILVLLSLISFQSFSAELPVCDRKMVLNSCTDIKARATSEFLTLAEGIKIKNPYFRPAADTTLPTGPFGGPLSEADKISQEAQLSLQADILAALGESKKKLSDRFKLSFVNQGIGSIISVSNVVQATGYMGGGMGAAATTPTFQLPFPSDQKNAELKSMSLEEIRKILDAETIKKIAQANDRFVKKFQESLTAGNSMVSALPAKPTDEELKVSENKTRLKEAFEDTKSILQSVILKGRREKDLSKEEQSLLTRVKTIKLVHGDDRSVKNDPTCQGEVPNAFYQQITHTINICPSFYSLPTATLYEVIGHEIGHSLDPCRSSDPLVRKQDGQFVLKPDAAVFGDRFAPNASIVGVEMDEKNHPFRKLRSCLASRANFREVTRRDLKRSAELEARLQQSDVGFDDKKRRELQREILENKRNNQCDKTLTHASEMNEAMSDVFGALAAESYFEKHPPKNSLETLTSAGNLQYICSKLEMFPVETRTAFSAHPSSINRFERIFLQIPQAAQAMGCKVNPEYSCFSDLMKIERSEQSSQDIHREGVR